MEKSYPCIFFEHLSDKQCTRSWGYNSEIATVPDPTGQSLPGLMNSVLIYLDSFKVTQPFVAG